MLKFLHGLLKKVSCYQSSGLTQRGADGRESGVILWSCVAVVLVHSAHRSRSPLAAQKESKMLEYILLSPKTYGWYASLSWDNNYCHPSFSTCCKSKEEALALMLGKIEKSGRLSMSHVKELPVIEGRLTMRAPDPPQRWVLAANLPEVRIDDISL